MNKNHVLINYSHPSDNFNQEMLKLKAELDRQLLVPEYILNPQNEDDLVESRFDILDL